MVKKIITIVKFGIKKTILGKTQNHGEEQVWKSYNFQNFATKS